MLENFSRFSSNGHGSLRKVDANESLRPGIFRILAFSLCRQSATSDPAQRERERASVEAIALKVSI